MIRTKSLLALLGLSLSISTVSTLSAPSRADDSPAHESEKVEAPSTAAAHAASGPSKTASPAFYWPTTIDPVKKSKEKGLPNFGKLNDFIWRSGQPTKEGYARLKELGVKTIVNLRKEAPADKDNLPEGINYVNIPIQDERAPTPEQAQQFLEIASDPNNWPLLVHCHGGEGRAGVMSGLVRYSLDGWGNDKIMKETDRFRVAYLGFIKTKMCSSQRDFLKEWEGAHKPGEFASKLPKSAQVAANK